MKNGNRERKFEIKDMIEISKNFMQIHKLSKTKKLSINQIDQISEIY